MLYQFMDYDNNLWKLKFHKIMTNNRWLITITGYYRFDFVCQCIDLPSILNRYNLPPEIVQFVLKISKNIAFL